MALRNQPYVPLYVQDFSTDEKLAECSAASCGVLIRLMCLMHKQDEYGKILLKQKDKQSSEQIINFASKVAKHFPYPFDVTLAGLTELVNEGVLTIDGDYLIQKRMVKDCAISEKRAIAGQTGGKITQQFAKAKDEASAKAKSEATSEYEIESENEDEGEKENEKYSFDDFWNRYGKKVGKPKAVLAWKKLSEADKISAVELMGNHINGKEKQFCKDPERYLRDKRWTDEPTNPPQPTPSIDFILTRKEL